MCGCIWHQMCAFIWRRMCGRLFRMCRFFWITCFLKCLCIPYFLTCFVFKIFIFFMFSRTSLVPPNFRMCRFFRITCLSLIFGYPRICQIPIFIFIFFWFFVFPAPICWGLWWWLCDPGERLLVQGRWWQTEGFAHSSGHELGHMACPPRTAPRDENHRMVCCPHPPM